MFTAKLDASGNFLWAERGAGTFTDKGFDVACDASGNIFVTGQFSDTITFDTPHYSNIQSAIFVVKYNPAGVEQSFAMAGAGTACRNCHMPRTGKAGAGRAGLLLGTPTGLSSDANITYWEGDQAGHVFKPVAHKFDPGIAGVRPGLAMPTPYTNSCGTCHDASKLQYQAPR